MIILLYVWKWLKGLISLVTCICNSTTSYQYQNCFWLYCYNSVLCIVSNWVFWVYDCMSLFTALHLCVSLLLSSLVVSLNCLSCLLYVRVDRLLLHLDCSKYYMMICGTADVHHWCCLSTTWRCLPSRHVYCLVCWSGLTSHLLMLKSTSR